MICKLHKGPDDHFHFLNDSKGKGPTAKVWGPTLLMLNSEVRKQSSHEPSIKAIFMQVSLTVDQCSTSPGSPGSLWRSFSVKMPASLQSLRGRWIPKHIKNFQVNVRMSVRQLKHWNIYIGDARAQLIPKAYELYPGLSWMLFDCWISVFIYFVSSFKVIILVSILD